MQPSEPAFSKENRTFEELSAGGTKKSSRSVRACASSLSNSCRFSSFFKQLRKRRFNFDASVCIFSRATGSFFNLVPKASLLVSKS